MLPPRHHLLLLPRFHGLEPSIRRPAARLIASCPRPDPTPRRLLLVHGGPSPAARVGLAGGPAARTPPPRRPGMELVLRDNKLTKIPDASIFKGLLVFDVSFNEIPSLNGLSKVSSTVKELYVSKNEVAKIEELEHFHALEMLELGSNRLRVVVFLSTCDSVDFHHTVLSQLERSRGLALDTDQKQKFLSCKVFRLHGSMDQEDRKKSAILVCTDVAARGLDIPKVKCIIQYDSPGNQRQP